MLQNNVDYRQLIKNMVDKIDNIKLLRRIYALAEYLYINKDKEGN